MSALQINEVKVPDELEYPKLILSNQKSERFHLSGLQSAHLTKVYFDVFICFEYQLIFKSVIIALIFAIASVCAC